MATLGLLLVSGGTSSDPRTPPSLPGLPQPFLTAAVLGDGGLDAGIDAYGDVVDLRPSPAGRALIINPAARQEAGTVPADTGIVPRVALGAGTARPLWRANSIRQRYLPGTNVLRTVARFDAGTVWVECAAHGARLACLSGGSRHPRVTFQRNDSAGVRFESNDPGARRIVAAAGAADRRWLRRARPLGAAAPRWARHLYRRSLLVLHALRDGRSGALAAGAREGWAYVWPRDAGAAAIALTAAGYRAEARRTARFLDRLRLGAAARFDAAGRPVPGRAAEGDAWGWAAAAGRAAGVPDQEIARLERRARRSWLDRPDYQEKGAGDYLANALASGSALPTTELRLRFSADRGGVAGPGELVREAGKSGSGLDSAAAWAVRPFPAPALFPAVRVTLERLLEGSGPFGIVPSENWPQSDPWTAPTAWSAWSLAALARVAVKPARARRERAAALRLLTDLRRAATAAGLLPERVGATSGVPISTTPLAWSHAFAILAIRQLWPGRRQRESQ